MIDLLVTGKIFWSHFFGRKTKEEYPTPLTRHQLWLVSLGAPLLEGQPLASHFTLYPFLRMGKFLPKFTLKQTWEADSRDKLLATLQWLRSGEHSASMKQALGHQPWAWDIVRYAITVRAGFAAGFMTEQEAWELLAVIKPVASNTYDSWKAYGHDFMLARQTWMGGIAKGEDTSGVRAQDETQQIIEHLQDPANSQSPWQRVEWEAIHQPDGPLPANPEDLVTIQSKNT